MFADYRLSNSVAELFRRLSPEKIRALYASVAEASLARGMDYEEEDGSPRIIPLFLRPRLIDEAQRAYFYKACMAMNDAFDRLLALRREHPALKEILPLSSREEEWFSLMDPAMYGRTGIANFARWDANADFSGMRWKGGFHFFEVNGVGVGGIHYSPTAEGIVHDVVFPALQEADPDLSLHKNDDARDLLLHALRAMAVRHGLKKPRIGFLVDMRTLGGPNEFPKLAQYAQGHGLESVCCDARDLRLKDGAIWAGDKRVDLLYRDTTLEEFVEMEEAGEDMSAMRHAVRQNLLLSSLGGELDHKSCFEIFSDPQYHRWFTPLQRRFFMRHVLWTRVLRECRTTDFRGREIDLLKYVRMRQSHLLIKPNRGFGGVGIVLGEQATRKEWRVALQRALQEKGAWVVQRKATVHKKKFPALDSAGRIVQKPLNVVCGFIATGQGLAVLGRASPGKVVNVAQKGGMTAILVCMNR